MTEVFAAGVHPATRVLNGPHTKPHKLVRVSLGAELFTIVILHEIEVSKHFPWYGSGLKLFFAIPSLLIDGVLSLSYTICREAIL